MMNGSKKGGDFSENKNLSVDFFENKKAQVTVFIIIAVVIVAVTALFFVLRGSLDVLKSPDEIFLDQQVNIIRERVDDCVYQSAQKVIFINSLQGGYYEPAQDSFRLSLDDDETIFFVPKYINFDQNKILSRTALENQFSLGVKKEVQNCFDFSDLPIEIIYDLDNAKFTSLLSKNSIRVQADLPITLTSNLSSQRINNFEITLDSKYLQMYLLATKLTEQQYSNREYFCVSCVTDESFKSGFDISTEETQDSSSETVLYSILYYDDSKNISEIYLFAHRLKLLDGGEL